MSDYRELSRLPDDPAYWDALEARVLAQADLSISEESARRRGWWTPFARHAWQLGAFAAAATVTALLLLPPRPEPAAAVSLLPLPADPLFNRFFDAATPPTVGALVVGSDTDGTR